MTTVWSSMIIDSDPVIATRTSQRFAGALISHAARNVGLPGRVAALRQVVQQAVVEQGQLEERPEHRELQPQQQRDDRARFRGRGEVRGQVVDRDAVGPAPQRGVDRLRELGGSAHDPAQHTPGLVAAHRQQRAVARRQHLEVARVHHRERPAGGGDGVARVAVGPDRDRSGLVGHHEEAVLRDVEDDPARGVTFGEQHVHLAAVQAPAVPVDRADPDGPGRTDFLVVLHRLHAQVHRRVGPHQHVDQQRRHELSESRGNAELGEPLAEVRDVAVGEPRVGPDRAKHRDDGRRVDREAGQVVEVGHTAAVLPAEERLEVQRGARGAREQVPPPGGGDLGEDIVVAEVVHVAVAVEQQHLLRAAEVLGDAEQGRALLGTDAGVEQVEGVRAAVGGDRRQVGVLPHRVRVVALDHDEVGGDLVQVSCGHGADGGAAVSHGSHTRW